MAGTDRTDRSSCKGGESSGPDTLATAMRAWAITASTNTSNNVIPQRVLFRRRSRATFIVKLRKLRHWVYRTDDATHDRYSCRAAYLNIWRFNATR